MVTLLGLLLKPENIWQNYRLFFETINFSCLETCCLPLWVLRPTYHWGLTTAQCFTQFETKAWPLNKLFSFSLTPNHLPCYLFAIRISLRESKQKKEVKEVAKKVSRYEYEYTTYLSYQNPTSSNQLNAKFKRNVCIPLLPFSLHDYARISFPCIIVIVVIIIRQKEFQVKWRVKVKLAMGKSVGFFLKRGEESDSIMTIVPSVWFCVCGGGDMVASASAHKSDPIRPQFWPTFGCRSTDCRSFLFFSRLFYSQKLSKNVDIKHTM